jgi:hypothetical protein
MAKAKNTKATPKAKPAGPTKAEVLAARDAKIVAAYKSGTDVPDLAPKFGLSGVRIYRILGAKNVTLRPRPKADPKPATKGKGKTAKKATKKAATKKAAPRKAAKAKPAGKASASNAPSLALPKSQSARRPNKPTPSDS